ncbi:hypothetical protein LTR22_026876 [Elasticomyces elasticus]|nr:hypothetical protein LTR22_026876 [Elasticomyces elasticus]
MRNCRLPQEILDQRDDYFDSRHHSLLLDVVPSYGRHSLRDLKNLRLASKTTCKAASPYFFQDFDARTPVRASTLATEWQHTLLGFTEKPWLRYVRTLKIGTRDTAGVFSPRGASRGASRDRFLVACAYAVPAFVRNCSALQAIRVEVDATDVGFTADKEPNWQRDLLLLMILNALRECSRTIASLEISLPLTADFRTLHYSIIKTPALLTLLSKITSTSLTINDATGLGGVRYWITSESGNQREYPNQQYQAGLWDFTQLMPALHALSIQCTHMCDFTRLSHTSFQGLEELKLTRVEVSSSRFGDIVQKSSVTLRSIELYLVELTSGTWSEVLISFCGLSGLLQLSVQSCGYSATGTSSHFRPGLEPEPDNPRAIETHNGGQDLAALGAVQRYVNSLRKEKFLEQYDEHNYRYMNFERQQ